jgi:hypothetical protein
MHRPDFPRSGEARRPTDSRVAAAFGPAVFALAALGCGTRSGYGVDLVYAGTGSTQTTGVAAADLGHQDVDVRICGGVRRHFLDEPQSFAAIAVGRGCVIPAEQAGSTVIGEPGSMCTVRLDGRVHRLRVTDATVTFPERAMWTRSGLVRTVDDTLMHARIGGDESDGAGGVRHSLFLFEGPLLREGDAEDWCVARLPEPAPAPAVRTEPVGEPVEANGF